MKHCAYEKLTNKKSEFNKRAKREQSTKFACIYYKGGNKDI